MPTYVSIGTIGTGSTSVTPGLPASLATGDGVLIMVVTKPDTATVNTPANWTLVADVAGGGGTTGNQVGPTRQTWFFREKDASWSTMPAISVTSGNSTAAVASRWTKTSGNVWDIAAATGVYGTSATTTSASATLGSNPGLQAGDAVACGFSNMNDAVTWSAESATATGVSAWGSFTERSDVVETSTGNDVGGVIYTGSVTTGTSTAAPVMTGTLSTAGRGTAVMVRLREIVDGTGSETPSVSAADAGARIITNTDNDDSGTTDANTDLKTILSRTEDSGSVDDFNGQLTAGPVSKSGAEAPSLSVAETSSIAVTQPGSESPSLSVTETSSILKTIPASDSSAISVSDVSSTISSTLAGSQTHSLSVSDVSAIAVTLSTTDTVALSVSDISNAGLSAPGSDSVAVSVSETSAPAVSLSASDASAVSVSETTATTAGISASEARSLSIVDTSAVVVTVPGSESNSLSVTDASSVVSSSNPSATDAAAISVADVSTSNSTLSGSQAHSLSISDASAVAVTMAGSEAPSISVADASSVSIVTAVSASDTVAVSVSDASSPAVSLAGSQTHALSVTDASARSISVSDNDDAGTTDANKSLQLQATKTDNSGVVDSITTSGAATAKSASDSAELSVADSSSVAVTVPISASQGHSLSVSDVSSTIASSLPGSQSHALSVSDTSVRTITTTTTTDSGTTDANKGLELRLGKTDNAGVVDSISVSGAAISKTASDSGEISIADSSSVGVLVPISASQTHSLSVADIANVGGGVATGSQTHALSVTETSARVITAVDSDTAGTTDANSQVATGVSRTDNSGVEDDVTGALDGGIGNVVSNSSGSSDVGRLVDSYLQGIGTDDAGASDSLSASKLPEASDSTALSVSETSSIGYFLSFIDEFDWTTQDEVTSLVTLITASDTTAISVSETRTPVVAISRTDAAAISVSESRVNQNLEIGAETTAISVSESRSIVIAINRSDSTALKVTEHGSIDGRGYHVKVYHNGAWVDAKIKVYHNGVWVLPTVRRRQGDIWV